jgi:phage-related minor tail protein
MNNDQEWRTHLFDEIKELRNDVKELKGEMMTLKVRVASFSAFIGSIVSVIFNKFME